MLYFAYGSNMDWQQMVDRCPSAKFVCIAKLNNHRLAFTRKSIKRGCGVVDAVPQTNSNVWGVVFQIEEGDVAKLDKKEGFVPGRERNAYVRREICVYDGGHQEKPIAAMTYFVAEKQANVPPPNLEYKRRLIDGARYWQLPDEYVRELDKIKATE